MSGSPDQVDPIARLYTMMVGSMVENGILNPNNPGVSTHGPTEASLLGLVNKDCFVVSGGATVNIVNVNLVHPMHQICASSEPGGDGDADSSSRMDLDAPNTGPMDKDVAETAMVAEDAKSMPSSSSTVKKIDVRQPKEEKKKKTVKPKVTKVRWAWGPQSIMSLPPVQYRQALLRWYH